MKHLQWNQDVTKVALGALAYILTVKGQKPLNTIEKDMLLSMMEHIFEIQIDLVNIPLQSPNDLKAHMDEHFRARLMEFLIIMPYVNGDINPEAVQLADEFAKALKIKSSSLKLLKRMRDQHLLIAQICLARKMTPLLIPGRLSKKAQTIWKMIKESKGDPEVFKKYDCLKDYREGTLGKAFYDFYKKHHFLLPGEKHCIPSDLVVVHDLSHILSGFQPNYEGEISVAAFQAGYMEHYSWITAVIGLLDFHCQLGIDLPPHLNAAKGHFNPSEFMRALRMGMEMNCDLYQNWDYWSSFSLPVHELRKRFNIIGAKDII